MRRLILPGLVAVCVIVPLSAQRGAPPSTLAAVRAQQPPPPAPTQTPPPGQPGGRGRGGPAGQGPGAPAMRGPSLPSPAVNVRLELAITDTYAGAPSKKTVSLVIANGSSGAIRTANRLPPDNYVVNLNVDARAHVFAGDVISVDMTFQYTPAQSPQAENRPARPADLSESVSVLLQDGKAMIVSQSADPATDRKVTAEVTATIVK